MEDIRLKAIQTFGFEDCRTIAICVLVEQGRNDIAEQLFEVLTESEENWNDVDLIGFLAPHSVD